MKLLKKIIDTENPLVQRWLRDQFRWWKFRHMQLLTYAALLFLFVGLVIYHLIKFKTQREVGPGSYQQSHLNEGYLFFLLVMMFPVTTMVPYLGVCRHFIALRKKSQLEEYLLTPLSHVEHTHALWVAHGLFHVIVWTVVSIISISMLFITDPSPTDGSEVFIVLWLITYPALQTLWSFSVGLFWVTHLRNPKYSPGLALLTLLLPGVLYLLLGSAMHHGGPPLVIITLVKFCIAPTLYFHLREDLNERLRKTIYPE